MHFTFVIIVVSPIHYQLYYYGASLFQVCYMRLYQVLILHIYGSGHKLLSRYMYLLIYLMLMAHKLIGLFQGDGWLMDSLIHLIHIFSYCISLRLSLGSSRQIYVTRSLLFIESSSYIILNVISTNGKSFEKLKSFYLIPCKWLPRQL